MATKYVNKSGSDANGGTSTSDAWLTINKACGSAASGDLIIVGAGLYNEQASIATAYGVTKTLSFYADGIVIMDGTGLAAGTSAIYCNYTYGAITNLRLYPYSSGGQWIIRNYQNTCLLLPQDGNGSIIVQNVLFYGNGSSTTAIGEVVVGASTSPITATFCLFAHFSSYAIFANNSGGSDVNFIVQNCTITDCPTPFPATVHAKWSITNCIFNSGTTAVAASSSSYIANLNFNLYYGFTNLLNINGTLYTTLAAVQALGYEANGIAANPNFVSTSQDVYALTTDTTINAGRLPYGFPRGQAYDPNSEWSIDSSHDNTKWYNASGNISKNGTTGFFELTSGTSDTVASPVWDLGSVQLIDNVDLFYDDGAPTLVVDTTNTDTKPNHWTLEIRASGSSYNQDDGTVPWVEVGYNYPFSAIAGRYVQIRLTLRSNGVAA